MRIGTITTGTTTRVSAASLGLVQNIRARPPTEGQHVAERDRDRGTDDREDEGGVRRQAREHLAGHDPLVEAGAHPDHPVVDRAADVGDHPLAEAGHEVEAGGGADGEERRDPDGGEEVGVDERDDSAKKLSTTRRTASGRLSVRSEVATSAAIAPQAWAR